MRLLRTVLWCIWLGWQSPAAAPTKQTTHSSWLREICGNVLVELCCRYFWVWYCCDHLVSSNSQAPGDPIVHPSTSLGVCCRSRSDSPLPLPSSIRLLARRPRIPELLRLFVSALALRISLLRFITGVSAKGRAIFVVLSSSSGAGAGVSCWVVRFFFTVTGRNPGLGERSLYVCDLACAALCGEGDCTS